MERYEQLCEVIGRYDRVAVCLSGGSDSALVAKAAVDALGAGNVIGITVNTDFLTGEELEISARLCKFLGIELLTPRARLLLEKEIVRNGEDRCYHCKRCMSQCIRAAAQSLGIHTLLDGSTHVTNADDTYGAQGLRENAIVSPLKEVNMEKQEIFSLLREKGMRRFVRPENSCLATRMDYGDPITVKKLRWVRAAENYIRQLGFDVVRVRVCNREARIEVEKDRVADLEYMKEDVVEELQGMGYETVTIDPAGYRPRPCGVVPAK